MEQSKQIIHNPSFNVDFEIIESLSNNDTNLEKKTPVQDQQLSEEKPKDKKNEHVEYKENNNNNKEAGKGRRVCVEVLKNIQNSLYGTGDVEVLLMVKENLMRLMNF